MAGLGSSALPATTVNNTCHSEHQSQQHLRSLRAPRLFLHPRPCFLASCLCCFLGFLTHPFCAFPCYCCFLVSSLSHRSLRRMRRGVVSDSAAFSATSQRRSSSRGVDQFEEASAAKKRRWCRKGGGGQPGTSSRGHRYWRAQPEHPQRPLSGAEHTPRVHRQGPHARCAVPQCDVQQGLFRGRFGVRGCLGGRNERGGRGRTAFGERE